MGAKRSKSEAEAAEPAKETTNKGLYIELPENATQLDELRSLLELAESVADDPEKAIPLLRGVIHECDAIVRSHQDPAAAADAQEERVPLDAAFWTLYGDAMVLLGQMEFREEAPQVVEFVQQAMDFYDNAIMIDDNKDKMTVLKRAVASCLLFALGDEDAFDDEFVMEALTSELDLPQLKTLLSGILEAANEADNCERVITLLHPILHDTNQSDGDAELSLIHLRLANYYAESKLEHIVDSQGECDDDDDAQFDTDLLQLSDMLLLRLEQCRDESDAGMLVRGESVMLRSSALELLAEPTAEHAQLVGELEAEAVRLFKEAEARGVELPEGILDFVHGK